MRTHTHRLMVHRWALQRGRPHHATILPCRFFVGSHTSVADAEVAVLVADLLAADRGHTRSLIPKLHKLYCSPAHAQQTPPMELLQHPKVSRHSLALTSVTPICLSSTYATLMHSIHCKWSC